ncbi:MAG: DUF1822 family protein [Synechococcales bacterium]|nr:DUF1822 family protein [Synechococcales bacterium]
MTDHTEIITFTVPISFEAHSIAETLCQQLCHPDRARQVYLNTLAVYAVDVYLRCMGIETDWPASDSRNPLIVEVMDVADLKIKPDFRLECRPVLADMTTCPIPAEAQSDRVGYVIVQISQSLKQATLLGFVKEPSAQLPLTQLQPLDNIFQYFQP